jgi:hypothetical protein
MSFADAWFHDDEKVAGSQTKEENQKVVKRSHLKGLVGPHTAPLARPSGYESRKLLQKKMQEKAKKDEEKKKNKKTLRQTILLQQQGKSTRE